MKIDRLITTAENKSEEVNLHELFHAEVFKQVKIKLLSEYHDYLDVFDWAMINQLSLHCFYDHKIELINEEMFFRSTLYQMFNHKLQKIKKYLINHLNKEFIFFSSASYISLILFIEKKNDSLRFCINYRKLNALIKRNRYSLSLIDKTFACIQESKYLTRLNIIVTFNKLCMHSDSKDLTIFIIFCYEHAWINQGSDLTLINLIKASHDAMPSLNLAHFYWILWVILSTSSRCSALSSFISFIILLGKHVWHITSHLYRV